MLYRSRTDDENVTPIKVDYSSTCIKCTYTRDSKPAKDPFEDKRLKGEWIK